MVRILWTEDNAYYSLVIISTAMLLNNGLRACFEPVSTSKHALVLVASEAHRGTHPAVYEIIVILSLTHQRNLDLD